MASAKPAQPGGLLSLIAWVKTMMTAVVYATLIVTFVAQSAKVQGSSMEPTLSDGDRLVVNKLAYRFRDPQVGDIVMLYYPLDPDKTFVKRIVAGPTDVIRSVEGQLYRNDTLLPDDFATDEVRSVDTWGPEVIKPGSYFVVGDHRNSSSDSRAWGSVPRRYIIGRVQLRWWPISSARFFHGFK
jgi:signal peptidase I